MSQSLPALQLLGLEITARSALAFPERKPGTQFRESLPFVPGAAIYGALGRLLADQGIIDGDLDATMAGVRCHNAYPAWPGDSWSRPLPLSALQPKGSKQAVVDGLVARVCWEQQQPPALLYVPTDAEGRPWERPAWNAYTLANTRPARRDVEQRVLTRVAIDRERGTAVDQRLYSPLVISEIQRNPDTGASWPARFIGSIALPADDAVVQPLLARIDALGGRQSTGLGLVTMTVTDAQQDSPEALKERIEQLTARFKVQATRFARLGGRAWAIAGSLFTVNLLGNAILHEAGWLPTSELSGTLLRELTQNRIDAQLLRSFTRTTTAAGWNVMWQRPKPTAVAVTAGSLYLFSTTQPLTLTDCRALHALQLNGIGERRPEGYGQIRICDAFHIQAPTNVE